MTSRAFGLCLIAAAGLQPPGPPDVAFRAHDIQRDWGVVYAVRIADVNADGRPDVVAINPSQLAWFENPSWQRHVVVDGAVPRDHVTIAAADVDGDGRVEIALGAGWNPRNTTSGGTLHLATRSTPDGRAPWTLTPLADEPTLHRIGWARIAGRRALIVTPLHGRGTAPPAWEGVGARIFALMPPPAGAGGEWTREVVDDTRHILHNVLIADFDDVAGDELVTASREGLTLFTRDPEGTWRKRMLAEASPGEVAAGRIATGRVLATIEPWHGTSVVTYLEAAGAWARTVIDPTVTGGHALAWADFDGDGHDELVAGWRDGAYGLARYRIDGAGRAAGRQLVDTAVAVEDLAVADLDADGRPDIVAGGRSTGNIRVFFNEGRAK
jgi:hypothetical protein